MNVNFHLTTSSSGPPAAAASSESPPPANFSSLPVEVIKLVLGRLSREEQVPLIFTCRRISRLCATPSYEKDPKGNWLLKLLGQAVRTAAAARSTNLIEWYRTHLRCPWMVEMFVGAASDGNINMLEWLLTQGCPFNATEITAAAARGGHLDVLDWLIERACPSPPPAFLEKGRRGVHSNRKMVH